jgi:HSP20 family protein
MTTMDPLAPWLRDLNRLFTTESNINSFMPPADVIATDDGVQVYMDLPGVSGEQIDIELENDTLTIRGERPFPYGQDGGRGSRRVERGFGRFERTLRVPRGLDPEAVTASLKDGVLSLQIPKPESLKPRKIQVQADESGPRTIEGAEQSEPAQQAQA